MDRISFLARIARRLPVWPPLIVGLGPARQFAPDEAEGSTVTDPGLKTFFEQSGDPMLLLNADLSIAVANPAAGRFLQTPVRQLRDTPALEVGLLARLLTAASIPQRIRTDPSPIVDEVAVTVVHEVAHHFGIDDDELHDLGYG
jgi:PAS domain-containing protein